MRNLVVPTVIEGLPSESFVLGYRKKNRSSEGAVLLFHGFPANKGNKNSDVAEALFSETPYDIYIIHYRGLGNAKGAFSFSHSILESVNSAKALISRYHYEQVHLIGHSWGGLVAMNVFREIARFRGKLLLLSPFNEFPDNSVLSSIIESVIQEIPVLFGHATLDSVLDDLESVKSSCSPRNIASTLQVPSSSITIIQASRDEEVSVASTKVLCKLFPCAPKYLELDQDHSFSNREDLVRAVLQEFR
ncbi:MAG: hypothetical protein A2428_07070 [Bdellovibrionales bacterium RIFOXYC1_FULL_54_43]|nr:MAG: hypothetical protein A2428_07070 [Bdellovibrionales bacterium RIFOXYC1_FULL_54_43]OFZ82309.1 MAG: hypothetical protein A2603_07600 [Bdellovibrionales bacterium RIFOXYD1_FULL_55_31]